MRALEDPLDRRKVDCGQATPQQSVDSGISPGHEVCGWKYSGYQLSPSENEHSQEEGCPAGTLWFHDQKQDRPNKVEVLFHGERPEVSGIVAALLVDSERHVITVKQQATRQIGIIYWHGGKYRSRIDSGQGNIVRWQYPKTSPYIETAQTDATGARKLLQQKAANKKTADSEEDVYAMAAANSQLCRQRVIGEEVDSTVEENYPNNR